MAKRRDDKERRCHFCGRPQWTLYPVRIVEHGLPVEVKACERCRDEREGETDA